MTVDASDLPRLLLEWADDFEAVAKGMPKGFRRVILATRSEECRLMAQVLASSTPAEVEAGTGEVKAWIANDPDGGPYLTWSAQAAASYPNPIALYTHPAPATALASSTPETESRDG